VHGDEVDTAGALVGQHAPEPWTRRFLDGHRAESFGGEGLEQSDVVQVDVEATTRVDGWEVRVLGCADDASGRCGREPPRPAVDPVAEHPLVPSVHEASLEAVVQGAEGEPCGLEGVGVRREDGAERIVHGVVAGDAPLAGGVDGEVHRPDEPTPAGHDVGQLRSW
jgi:hypothetical protein